MIIDVHTHITGKGAAFHREYPGLTPDFDLTAAAMIKNYLDPASVDKAVILSIDTPDAVHRENIRLPVEDALEAQRDFPGRFIVFASVDAGLPGRADRLRAFVDAGCRGLGEIKHTPFHDPRHDELFEVCAEAGIPVLGHVDQDLTKLERVLKKFPTVNFIPHGPEFWSNLGAPANPKADDYYPGGKVRRDNAVAGMLDQYGNLYADVSAGSGFNALTRDRAYGEYFVKTYCHKLIFGTDWPCLQEQKLPPIRFGENRSHLSLLEEYLGEGKALEHVLSANLLSILPAA